MEIKNLTKTANRIRKAIKKGEKIILYGDADLDGVVSVIILKETIKNLGGLQPTHRPPKGPLVETIYFPDRETEGYGITEIGLNYLKNFAPALLITLDLGIGNFKEVKLAKKLGFEIIIIDHHEVLDKLPEAKIIVNPKQKGDKYPFKGLSNAGIVFKLSELLLEAPKITENLRRNFLELAALATLADMMPKESENEFFIKEGFKSLENSWRPGIKAFFEMKALDHYLNLNQKVSKVISLLNIRDVAPHQGPGGGPASFRLLSSPSLEESKKLIERLLEKSSQRKEKIERILQEIEARILKGEDYYPPTTRQGKEKHKFPIIFEGDENFAFTLISPVASQLCQKYQKPTFIFKKLEKESQGTVRTPSGIDSVALMKKCKRYLITYGGHPLASGFRIKNENLEKFKTCLLKQV